MGAKNSQILEKTEIFVNAAAGKHQFSWTISLILIL